MADHVMRMEHAGPIHHAPLPIQRKCSACEEEEKVMPKSLGGEQIASERFGQQLQSTSGQGQSLAPEMQARMGYSFGTDFRHVRVHTGTQAEQMNQSIQAKAFTHGSDIYFNQGQYNPRSSEGKHLLAHELTHVVQQGGGNDSPAVQRRFNWTNGGIGAGLGALGGGLLGAGIGALAGGGIGALIGAGIGLAAGALIGLGIGGSISKKKYDANVDHANRLLTLTMRINFQFSDEVKPWPSEEAKEQWAENFINVVQNRWSYRYYLVKTGGNCPEVENNVYFARMRVIADNRDPHYVVKVRNTDTFQQSYVNWDTNTAVLDSLDTQDRTDINQNPAEHEFGHMLGLPHIHCDSNDDICYGVTPEESRDVMGRGKVVSHTDYQPFVDAIKQLTGCEWIASHHILRPEPSAPGDYPLPSRETAVV